MGVVCVPFRRFNTLRHKLDLGVYLKLLRWRKLHAASCDCDGHAVCSSLKIRYVAASRGASPGRRTMNSSRLPTRERQ